MPTTTYRYISAARTVLGGTARNERPRLRRGIRAHAVRLRPVYRQGTYEVGPACCNGAFYTAVMG